jgi:segregation and condensation protein B
MSTSNPTEPRNDEEQEQALESAPENEAEAEGDADDESEEPVDISPHDEVVSFEGDEGPEPDVSLEKLRLRARQYPPERVRAILEGLLFVSDKPMPLDALEKVTGISPEVARNALEQLRTHYQTGMSGIVLHEVADGWQLRSGPESAEFVRRMLQIKPQRLTRPALETLAVIAYRQPVTRPEIEEIRSVDCGAVLKALLERKLIKILGKKEEPGHPLLYGTTREFLEFFNLKNLASLPTLREFQELSEESRQIVEQETGEPAPEIAGTVQTLADPEFVARQKASTEASEKALADLEAAMKKADVQTKATEELLRPPKPEEPAAEPGAKTDGQPGPA